MDFNLRQHTILLTVAGSRAYGIHTSESDVDVKGVAIPPVAYFLGYLHRFDQADKGSHMETFLDTLTDEERAAVEREKIEGSVYGLQKFAKLAADCNPNILDVLFCRDEEVRVATPLGERLREHRGLFLSAKAKHTFAGYAHAQLKRIKGHRAWLLNPPSHQPTRAEYDLPEFTLVPADQLAAAEAAVRKQIDRWEFDFGTLADSEIVHIQGQIAEYLAQITTALDAPEHRLAAALRKIQGGLTSMVGDRYTSGPDLEAGVYGVLEDIGEVLAAPEVDDAKWLAAARVVGLGDNLIHVMQKEREYTAAQRHWKQYQEWKRSRNPARAALEAAHGYDTKHGAHLVRLLRMGREIMETGQVNVWRGGIDADELLAIRAGAWDYDTLIEWSEREDTALQDMYKARKYVVPKAPDRNSIDRLVMDLVRSFHRLFESAWVGAPKSLDGVTPTACPLRPEVPLGAGTMPVCADCQWELEGCRHPWHVKEG